MTVRACTAAELSPEDAAAVAAVDAQAKEISRLKGDEGLGNKDPQVEAAVAELLRLKALLPESLQGPKRRTKEEKKAQKEQEQKAQSAGEGRTSAAVTQVKSDGKQQAMDLLPPRGTRDFYPEDMALRSWLFGQWRETARLYGFEEYDAPVLESEELYVRKAGEDVTQQLYNMEDRSGRKLALRPEMTPSLARMVLARRNSLALPLKWFSIPQCWRYERTTRGRRREHYQWNLDVWGAQELTAEAELLGAAVGFMGNIGITSEEVGVKVSTRSVLSELLVDKLGLAPELFASTCVLIDKLDKMPQEEVRTALQELGLPAASCDLLFSTLALKDLDALAKVLGDDSAAVRELKELFRLGAAYGYSDWLVLDLTVVRGLAYYTGVVFEGFDRSGELRAIFGGGRYDKLLGSFGGEDLPAAGFGFGDAVIVELLKMNNKLPSLSRTEVQAVVFPFEEELRETAMSAAAALRGAGMATDLVLEKKKTKWAFKHAEKLGADYLVFIAPTEAAEGNARVKDLATGEEENVPLAGLAKWVAARPSRSEPKVE